ncbi:MAG TPA: VanZ family protein [Anaerolinea sp.]|nr:VanZ family protein [Anaerolinea sp.]
MQIDFFPTPAFIGAGMLIILLPIVWRKQHSLRYLLWFTIFWAYLLAVVNLTLFPIPLPVTGEWRPPVSQIIAPVNLVPLKFGSLFDMPPTYALWELGGNLLLTIPLGFGIPVLTRVGARQVPWLALAAGISTELTQLITCSIVGVQYRSVDINDTLLNTFGVLAGYGFLRIMQYVNCVLRQKWPPCDQKISEIRIQPSDDHGR